MAEQMTFFRSYYEAVEELDKDIRLEVLEAIIRFGLYGEEPTGLSPYAKMAFTFARPSLEKSAHRGDVARANGNKGGRPRKETESEPTETQENPVKPSETQANPQKPHTIDSRHKTVDSKTIDVDNDSKTEDGKKKSAKALTEEVVTLWNSFEQRGIIPKVNSLSSTSTRYKMLQARISEHGLENVLSAVRNVFESSFLKQSTWFSFDWFVKPNNFVKVSDGNYRDKEQPVTHTESRGFRAIRDMDWGNDEQPCWEGQ